jgi:hypothetical protein
MTAASVTSSISGSRGLLAGELVDSLIEAVVLPADPLARSAVVCDLINELCDAVDWLHATEPQSNGSRAEETASLRQLVVAAHDHQLRMRTLCNGASRNGSER